MFKPNTLFVIGAGAGQEIGLPIGSELSIVITSKLDYSVDTLGVVSGGDADLRRGLMHQATIMGKGVQEYYDAGRQIRRGIQFSPSIDEYINKHKDNEVVQFCSKLAIAKAIIEAERGSAVFVDETTDDAKFANEPNFRLSWYLEFVRILHDGLAKNELHKILDDVTFINFNYDRCLEQVLFLTLVDSYGINGESASAALSRARIIHPYGSLGNLPHLNGGRGLAFGGVRYVKEGNLIDISQRIKTFYEQLQDEVEVSAMKDAIEKAENIIFLGFGFHPQNMSMLKANGKTNARRIYATAFGESDAGVGSITESIRAAMGNDVINASGRIYVNRHMKCAALIKEFSRDLSKV